MEGLRNRIFMASGTRRHHCGRHRRHEFNVSSSSFILAFPSLKILGPSVFCGPNDGTNRCGHQLDTDLCQNKVQTYQFNKNNSSRGV